MTVAAVFGLHEGLSGSTRIPAISRNLTDKAAVRMAALVLFGVGAALASGLIDYRLRIPGHAILRSVFPMARGSRAACCGGGSAPRAARCPASTRP